MKKVCSVLLTICLAPTGVIAQTIGSSPASRGDEPGLVQQVAAMAGAINSKEDTALRFKGATRSLRDGDGMRQGSAGSRSNRNLMIGSLALIGGGAALAALSYGEESYKFTSCPGCNPPVTSTLYRDTSSAGMLWGGVGLAATGVAVMIYGILKN